MCIFFGLALKRSWPSLLPVARLLAYLVRVPLLATAAHRAGHSTDADVSRRSVCVFDIFFQWEIPKLGNLQVIITIGGNIIILWFNVGKRASEP